MTGRRLDVLWAAAAGATALAVYVRTLAPGLTTDVDSALFQFIGRVLGVAHNPGYPLYVLLTHAVSYVPVGSLAYRINLFSALCGAVTVSLAFLVARRLGCRRVVSLAMALGMAFGHIFWSQAVIAEVYTLYTAILAGVLLALITWGQTGRAGWYFTAVALFAAGLGLHTTIVGFAPGIALYVLLTNRRFALRLSTLAGTAVIISAGLLQYGFIILRSNQPDAYVESRATTVGTLVHVMLARQFQERLFAFDWRTVVLDRIPLVVGRMLTAELTLAGLALAVAGAVWLLRHRLPEGLLLLTGCGAVLAFALNYSVVDTPVFLVPATLVLWLAAAVGAERAALVLGRYRWAVVTTGVAALMVPAWQVTHNFGPNDRSRDTGAAVQFDRLFDVLPDRAALISEDFMVDRMMMFKLLGDQSAGGRRIEVVPQDADVVRRRHADGFRVFGFPKSARSLRQDALDFSFEPLALMDGPLDECLSRLPDGTIVAISVPGRLAESFAGTPGVSFSAIGGPVRLAVRPSASLVIVGVRGARRGASLQTGLRDIRFDISSTEGIGDTGVDAPSAIEAWSGASDAAIRVGSRDIVRTSEGAAVATWDPDGRLARTFVVQARDGFRVPVPTGPLSVYPLRGVWASQVVPAQDWTDLARSLRTGSVMLRVPAGQAVVLYVSDDARLAPRVIDRSPGRADVDIVPFEDAPTATLRARLEADGVTGAGLDGEPHVYRMSVSASGDAPVSVLLALGGIPARAIGRVVRSGSVGTATAFSVAVDGLLRTPDRASDVLLMGRDDQAQLTGSGWSPVDWDAGGPYRWMTATEARLVLPIAKRDWRRIRVQALRTEQSAAMSIRLRLNGSEVPSQPLRAGWHAYEWTVPAGAVSEGITEAAVIVDRLSASPGTSAGPREIAVAEVRVMHGEG